MYGAMLLFEDELIHVVSISFTSLILTELLMVGLTVRTWHPLMVVAQFLSLGFYALSVIFMHYFGELFFMCTFLSIFYFCCLLLFHSLFLPIYPHPIIIFPSSTSYLTPPSLSPLHTHNQPSHPSLINPTLS